VVDWRATLKDHPIITIVTFCISVLSLVLSLLQYRVAFTATPQITSRQASRTIQVGITNNSSRGVSMTAARVVFDGKVIAEVAGVLLSVPEPGDPRFLDEIFSDAQALPVSLSAGQGIATTFILRPPDDASDEILSIFNGIANPPLDYSKKGQLRLQLEVVPGGTREAAIAFPPENVAWAGTEFQDPGHRPGWHSLFRLDPTGHVTSIQVGNGGHDPATAALRLWRSSDSAPFFESVRPLVGGYADFQLPSLAESEYSWAVEVEGKTVGSSTMAQPCGDGVARIGAEKCILAR
jgi:hypothetical protein